MRRPLPSIRGYLRELWSALVDPAPADKPSSPPVFSGDYASWEEAASACSGYDAVGIFEKTKAAILAVRDGRAAFERDSVLFDRHEHRWEVLAALFWQATRDQGRLSVLDFGGALGSVYYQSKPYLDGLASASWGVVDQPGRVDFGRKELSGPVLSFHDSIELCADALSPNCVLFGAVLQYLPTPYEALEKLLDLKVSSVAFDKLSVIDQETDRISIQNVPSEIYEASYPAWFFSEKKFCAFMADAGYRQLGEWRNIDNYALEGARPSFKGYHFVRCD